MITYVIDNLSFNILNKLVISDNKALSIEFLDDKKRKLDRVKEIEPYNIANNKQMILVIDQQMYLKVKYLKKNY